VGAREFSLKRFGFPTRPVENPVAATVGTTAAEILKNNPDRVFWLVVNLSVNVVYVSFGSDVGATKGIRLEANGGWASMSAEEDGEAVANQVYALATAAASAIYVLEIEKTR